MKTSSVNMLKSITLFQCDCKKV